MSYCTFVQPRLPACEQFPIPSAVIMCSTIQHWLSCLWQCNIWRFIDNLSCPMSRIGSAIILLYGMHSPWEMGKKLFCGKLIWMYLDHRLKEKSPWVYDWDKLLQYKYFILEKLKLFTIIIFSSGTTAIRHCKDVTSHVTSSVKLPIQISATLHMCQIYNLFTLLQTFKLHFTEITTYSNRAIRIILLYIGNSQWCLSNIQSKSDWLMLGIMRRQPGALACPICFGGKEERTNLECLLFSWSLLYLVVFLSYVDCYIM